MLIVSEHLDNQGQIARERAGSKIAYQSKELTRSSTDAMDRLIILGSG
jgi:hypothetical protein